jgi:DNA polymerase-1
MPRTLCLIDGNSLLYRGFFAMRALNTTDGTPTNAVFAFTQMLLTLLERHKPDAIYCAWDTPRPTFRHTAYPEYKGTRSATPDDLIAQGPLVRELVAAFAIASLAQPGFEADDIIGTLARQGRDAGYDVLIVTGDLDALQLVEDGVRVLTTVRGVTDTVLYDDDKVHERYGLRPDQLADYRALKGDPSDNIPGVAGIGEKTATSLLQTFDTVEALERRLDEVTPVRVQAAIRANLAMMALSKRLAVIERDVPIDDLWLPAPDDAPPYAPDYAAVRALFERLEFRVLLKRLPTPKPTDDRTAAQTRLRDLEADGYDPFSDDAEGLAVPALADAITEATEVTPEALQSARQAAALGVRLHASEGGPLDAQLLGIAIATSEAVLYDAPESLKALLEDPSVPKVLHDARTDLTVLARHGIALQGLAFDTQLAAYLLAAGRRASFPLHEIAADTAGQRVPAPLDKKERQGLDDDAVAARERAATVAGAAAVLALRAAQEPRLEIEGLRTVFDTLDLPLAPILSEMERTGLAVDPDVLRRLSTDMTARLAALETEIFALAGHTFLVTSPKQLAEVLFDKLKLPSGKKTKTGYSTDADVLEQLAAEYPIVALVLQHRELSKLKGTYTDALPALVRADTGRIHTSLNQTVAATGRLSSSNPNLQNIPIRTAIGREIRRAFIAPPGKVLLSADYSQIELRLFAHVAEDPPLIEAFDSGEDIHKYTASRVFGVPVADVTGDMRRAAKTVNYAVLYGISDFALGRQLKIPMAEAKTLKANYFTRFPGVKAYLDNTIEFARTHGYVQTLFGRRRWTPDIDSRIFTVRQAAERAASNMPIQGASADIMKLAMISVWEALHRERSPATLLLQVHDELLFEVPADGASALGARVKACMEAAYPLRVHLEADVKTGSTWADVTPLAESAVEELS